MPRKIFLNLTNGIEKLLDEDDPVSINDVEFVRIQSTTIERKNWIKLFLDLDHNLLINLALGNECTIYDYGTHRPYSKSIYQGVQIIKYILNRYWYGINPEFVPQMNRAGQFTANNMKEYYDLIYKHLFVYDSNKEKERVKKKLGYYKRFLNFTCVRLDGISESTVHDGDYAYYSKLLKNKNDLR